MLSIWIYVYRTKGYIVKQISPWKALRIMRSTCTPPPQLYDLYMMLYVKGYTQEGTAAELNYTPVLNIIYQPL